MSNGSRPRFSFWGFRPGTVPFTQLRRIADLIGAEITSRVDENTDIVFVSEEQTSPKDLSELQAELVFLDPEPEVRVVEKEFREITASRKSVVYEMLSQMYGARGRTKNAPGRGFYPVPTDATVRITGRSDDLTRPTASKETMFLGNMGKRKVMDRQQARAPRYPPQITDQRNASQHGLPLREVARRMAVKVAKETDPNRAKMMSERMRRIVKGSTEEDPNPEDVSEKPARRVPQAKMSMDAKRAYLFGTPMPKAKKPRKATKKDGELTQKQKKLLETVKRNLNIS
jgi:hypothetical protein